MAKVSAEIFLFANSRIYIEDKTSRGIESYLRGIIKDEEEYIVDKNLEIKPDANIDHPLIRISNEVNSKIKNLENGGVFNLGRELEFLTEPPFGIYANMVNYALMGFILRPFVGKLHEAGTGKPIEKEIMRDKIINLFKYWEENKDEGKLNVRLGTPEEKELVNRLKELFSLDDTTAILTDTRWKIREWVKDTDYPLWSFKAFLNKEGKKAIDEIFTLTKSIDKDIKQEDITNALKIIEENEVDLKYGLLKKKARNGFVDWLKNIEGVEIPDEKTVDEITKFLRINMQEETASWEEDSVREKVKDWQLKRYKQESLYKGDHTIRGEKLKTPMVKEDKKGDQEYSTHPERIEIEKVRQKIIAYKGDIKALMIKIIEENPIIANLINPYFEREEKHD
jgi:hypothetical protein